MKRIALLSIIGLGLSASAQEKSKLEDTVALVPVEVKAIRADNTAPFAKTNMGKAEIDKNNLGQDLPFLFNQTPSVVVNADAGNGIGYTGIRIRGTDATRINVTLNGIPFNDAESQGTYFVDVPDFLSSTNSIQIQRGVGTSSNGAGAFGASINLSTNEITPKAYAELNNTFGSFNTLRNTIKIGSGLLGKHFTIDARASRISSDGYIERAKSNLQSLYFSTAYFNGGATFRFNVFAGKEKTYQAWYGVSETDLKEHRTVNYAGNEKPGDPYDNQTDNYWQDHYQFFYNQKLSDKWVFNTGLFYIKGKGYYEQYKAAQKYANYGLTAPTGITKTDLVRQLWLDNDFYGDVFSLQYGSQKTNFTLGGAITRYNGKHFGEVTWAEKGLLNNGRYYDLKAHKNDQNVYAKWQQNLTNSLELYADAQWRHVQHVINGFKDNPTLNIDANYHFFNPKIGVTYHKNGWMAFASYSIANKEPNRDDFEAGLNQQPIPERLNDLEVGIEKKTANYNYGATIYYMDYKDQLVLTGKINDVGAYTRTNIPNSYRLGIELQGGYAFSKAVQVSANLALSKNKIKNFEEYIDDYDNGGQLIKNYGETEIAFSPSVVGAATVTVLPVNHLEVNLMSKYVSRQYLDNTENKSRSLNPYFTQDIRAIYSFSKAWLKNVSIIGQVNNVFNKLYEPNGYTYSYFYNNQLTTENYYFPMAGTNWLIGLNIKL
jgi:iron complex outermembrane receptor protein